MSHLKLQALRCDFPDDQEGKEHVLEWCIAGTKNKELQKELLIKNNMFTTTSDYIAYATAGRGSKHQPHQCYVTIFWQGNFQRVRNVAVTKNGHNLQQLTEA